MSRSLLRSSVVLVMIAWAGVAARAAAPAASPSPAASEPDYGEWNRLLHAYYDPAHGMSYGGLKARETPALDRLRVALGQVDPRVLDRNQQLAYWLNVYNVNIVATVVAGYPVASIRDLSTDPIIRLNVFKKDRVPTRNGLISLQTIEDDEVREGFHDPRIHFALNCAAKSCPPLRSEAYVGARVGQQLDDQVRRFVAGPGVRVENRAGVTSLHVTKILDWFSADFEHWGGGVVPFLRRFLPPEKLRQLPAGDDLDLSYDDYDWSLNDWHG